MTCSETDWWLQYVCMCVWMVVHPCDGLATQRTGSKRQKMDGWMYSNTVNCVNCYCDPSAKDEREEEVFVHHNIHYDSYP